MANYKGLSYSIVGDEKIPTTSLNRNSGLSKISGFSKLNFGVKPQSGLTFSFSKKKLLKNKLKNLVSIKPKLIDLTEYQSLGFQSSLVGFDEDVLLQGNIDKPMSPRLINYVEPYDIRGFRKTMFYTEVNSGLKVGDRVFIINGNYDSDLLIKTDKYKGGRDGYKVLFVDKCQIVLDIDYTGVLPYELDEDDNFLRVYFIDSIDDFISAEKAITTRGGIFDRKFNIGQNNIIYTNKNYGPLTIWDNTTKILEAPGFFVRTPNPILTIDTTFSSGIGFNIGGQVYTMLRQTDGKIIVGGSFTSYNGVIANKIIRLNSDGSIDLTFNSGTGFNGNVESIALQTSGSNAGKIIVGGKFTTYNGSSPFTSRLVRLNTSGSIDSSFMSSLPTFSWITGQEVITSIQVVPSNKSGLPVDTIYIAGGFETLNGGSIRGVARLTPNGILDGTFNIGSGFNGVGTNLVKVIKLQNNGRLLCGGTFTSFNGDNSIRKIVRLTTTGTIDVTFSLVPNGFTTTSSIIVNDIIVDALSVIIAGNFTTYDGQTANKLIKFDLLGVVDSTFLNNVNNLNLDSDVKTVIDHDGGIYLGGNFTNYGKITKISYNGSSAGVEQTVSNFNYTVYDIIVDSTGNLLVGGDFSYFNAFETRKIAKLIKNNWQNITDKFIQGSFSSALSNSYFNNNRLKVYNDTFTYSINELVEFKKDCVYEFGIAEEPNNYQGTYSTWKLDVKYSRPVLTKTNFRDGNFDGEWNVGLFGRQNKKIKWQGNKSNWNTGTLLNTEWEKGKINSDFTLLESYYSEIESSGLPSQKLNGTNNNNRGFNFIIDSTILKSEIENATIINSSLGSLSSTFSAVENNLLNISTIFDVVVRKAYFENCNFQNTSIKNSEIRSVRVSNSLLDNVKSVNSWIKKSVTKNSDYIADDIVKIISYDELDINVVSSLGTQPTHKVFKFYISKKDYQRLNQRDSFYIKGLDVVDGQKKLLNFFDKKFKISSWYEYDDTLSSANQFYKRGVDCAAFLTTPEENSYLYTTTVDLSLNATNSIVTQNQNKGYSVDIIYSLFDKDNQIVNGINFNRSSNGFQIYNNETILVKYMDGSTMFEDIVFSSGTYNTKPYYILNHGTPVPFSYIFWDQSGPGSQNPGNFEWQHYQSFSIFGGSGDYYATLEENGGVPITTTFSWQTAVDPNVTIQSIEVYNPEPTLSQSNNIININSAYIIESDYESGIIERSNWNSGYSINSNNDTNITKLSNEGGYYNLILQTSSSTLLATTGFNNFREVNEDTLELGSIVFLNSVYYDTRGKILSFTISNPGTGYSTQQSVTTNSINGNGSIFDVTALDIGAVTSITLTVPGTGYEEGPPAANPLATFTNVTTSGGSGVGLTVDITVGFSTGGQVIAATISNPGVGYSPTETVTVDANPAGSGATLLINTVSNGEVISATLSIGGIQYQVGDLVTLNSGGNDAQLQILSVTGSLIKLPDTYKIINIASNQYELQEIINGTSSLLTLSDGGIFYTPLANNRYGYLHQLKMTKNSIKSAFLKRIYLKNNLLQNSEINLIDKDFNNLLLFKKLVATDILFTDNSNILSKGSYIQSNFTSGTDYWDDGLLYNSVWNGGIFRKGLVKESSWHDGIFVEGTFYQSRSFNALPNLDYQYYDVDRIKNYWKDGPTTTTISNDRYSWRSGTFSNGEFLKSDWENGNFLKGKIYNSKWYSGTFSSGTIGDKSLSFSDTWLYSGLIKTAIVENAALYGIDTSYYGLSNSTIVWQTGTFNDGIFGCDILIQMTASHKATWYDGTFNGGEFRTNGKWITGVFNGGKFISGFGWTYSLTYDTISTSASQFAWETGEFNGGEFGDMGLATNSTWWSGEFNGGVYQGRYWNDGVFTAGKFKGSGTYSVVGGYSVDSMTESNASLFTDSFSQSFYGIWGGGYVTDVRDEFVKEKKLFTIPIRSVITNIPRTISNFENMLWLRGTFSHPGGTVFNSVWLDGSFNKGKFQNSSFNPWVIRPGDTSRSFNLNDDLINASGSCIWYSGTLEQSDFYISQWKTGQFISGTAFGMVWKNGVTNYMNAYNIMWEDGTWRNGNWNGSYFIFNGDITPEFNKQIIFRGMNWADSPQLHVWNVFEESINEELLVVGTVSGLSNYSSIQEQQQEYIKFNP